MWCCWGHGCILAGFCPESRQLPSPVVAVACPLFSWCLCFCPPPPAALTLTLPPHWVPPPPTALTSTLPPHPEQEAELPGSLSDRRDAVLGVSHPRGCHGQWASRFIWELSSHDVTRHGHCGSSWRSWPDCGLLCFPSRCSRAAVLLRNEAGGRRGACLLGTGVLEPPVCTALLPLRNLLTYVSVVASQ